MNQFQIGYLLVGPRRLSEDVKMDAVNNGVTVMLYLNKLWSYVSFFEECDLKNFIKDNPIPSVMSHVCPGSLIPFAGLCQKEFLSKSMTEFVKEFCEYWEDPLDYDDTIVKAYPGDNDKQILFAGCITENEPNTRGFVLCRLADLFGWFKLFGIQ